LIGEKKLKNILCKLGFHDWKHSPPIFYCRRCGEAKHNPTSVPPPAGAGQPDFIIHDVTADRSWGTQYTNPYDNPMIFGCGNESGYGWHRGYVDGKIRSHQFSEGNWGWYAYVPVDSTYKAEHEYCGGAMIDPGFLEVELVVK